MHWQLVIMEGIGRSLIFLDWLHLPTYNRIYAVTEQDYIQYLIYIISVMYLRTTATPYLNNTFMEHMSQSLLSSEF